MLTTYKVKTNIYVYSQAVCLNYRVNSKGECDFRDELVDIALSHPIKDICFPPGAYPDRCSIHNHPEFAQRKSVIGTCVFF